MKKSILTIIAIAAISLITACSATQNGATSDKNTSQSQSSVKETAVQPLQVLNGPNVTLVAKEEKQEIGKGVVVPVWTFNGSAPGPEIRVKKGDKVKITLKNETSIPVSIHFHGYPVPNNMDGIPGVTQDAVMPGKSFTYEFTANTPGTYWYHSHQDSVNQLDRGLYGAFVVEDPAEKYDKDYTLMLDEWMTDSKEIDAQVKEMTKSTSNAKSDASTTDSGMNGMNMDGMNMDSNKTDSSSTNSNNTDTNSMNMSGMNMKGHDMSMYNLYTINGKSGDLVKKLTVKEGDKVRLRFVNAGYLSHNIHIHGQDIKVIATDGQPINNPTSVKDQLLAIAPGERYDVEFTANHPGQWYIESHDNTEGAKGMKAIIQYEGSKGMTDKANEKEQLPLIDLTTYGTKKAGTLKLDQKYDVNYTMDLNTAMDGSNMVYTINGKTFPNTDPIQVKKGDLVKVTLKNNSATDNHPMHLHGHFFQVLSKNGKPLEGSPIMKDTLNLKPGEEYVVAFVADNPGEWMFHCHDLHHAAAGMVTEVKYTDYQSDYKANSSVPNMPE